MFGIGGGNNIFGSLLGTVAQVALGVATGGASMLIQQAMKSVMMSIGDQLIQKLGQSLGLPQSAIDLAQGAFHSAAGDPGGAVQNLQEAVGGLSDAAGFDAFQGGQLQRAVQDASDLFMNNLQEKLESGKDEEGNQSQGARAKAATAAAGGSGGQSFLVRLALAMGSAIDNKMNEMLDKAEQIDDAKGGGSGESQITKMGAELTALSQEVSILTNALNTSLKSIGEAASTLARKQ